ncbi:MAG: histidine kinase [Bacteroidales bacterium]
MVTKIALILSLLLQLSAAIIAIRLTKVTKYNLSWILISSGFILIVISRLIDIIPFFYEKMPFNTVAVITWIGFITSLFFIVGVILIQRIFKFLDKVEQSRREAEKRVLNAIIQTEEHERKRFAKDLHDGLGPLLSTVKMSVSTLSEMEQDESRKEILRNTDYIINEAIKSIKEISNNLSPHMLKNFGLASAIKNFTTRIVGLKVPNIQFESNLYGKRFGEEVEVIIYRVVCELINNTIKHAQARNIEIHLNLQEQMIILTYTDDGIGFDTAEVLHGSSKGMGYANMMSRIRSIKGTIEVESHPENGTRALLRVMV